MNVLQPLARLLVCLAGLLAWSAGVAVAQKKDEAVTFTAAFYNVENLFDSEDDKRPGDDDFTPKGAMQWNRKRWETKAENLARVFDAIGGERGPDLIGVCEVENPIALEAALMNKLIKQRRYQYVMYDSPDERGIDVALAYDPEAFKVIHERKIPIILKGMPDTLTRDALLVVGRLYKRDTLAVIVNHWPSRRNPPEARLIAARAVRSVVDSLLAVSPTYNILLMGDFNDTPTDPSLTQGLGASEDRKAPLWNATAAVANSGAFTHCYRKDRTLLDQLILSQGLLNDPEGLRYVDGSAAVFRPVWLQQPPESADYAGCPRRTFVGTRYMTYDEKGKETGFSDHYPVFLHLTLPPETKKKGRR